MDQTIEFIGREAEIDTLNRRYGSRKSEFIAVYGRRRVGKTYLIRHVFKDKTTFELTGLAKKDQALQLDNFYRTLLQYPSNTTRKPPDNWFDAFDLLKAHISQSSQKRKVIFIDELPWLDTPKSDFLVALESFWNGWASTRGDIFLIVCGSSTNWIINKLINHKGGLHNRTTERIYLRPFNLKEVAAFMSSHGAVYSTYDLLELYMTIGGIPYYLDQIKTDESIAQNIERLFFTPSGILRLEYENLYRSLFRGYQRHMAILEALAKKHYGADRKWILNKVGMKDGGTFSKILTELVQCGFIKKLIPYGKLKRDAIYKLSDYFTIFYLNFVKQSTILMEGSWLSRIDAPAKKVWGGLAFENICYDHIGQIKKALGISAVHTNISAWKKLNVATEGVQIDMLIDRRDGIINLCEIKFSIKPFNITKSVMSNLEKKKSVFIEDTNTNKTIFMTMITSHGLKENMYSKSRIQNDLSAEIFLE